MLSQAELDYHLHQYDTPYRSTRVLADFIKIVAGSPLVGSVLDVGCGAGANLYWLRMAKFLEGARVTGVDADPDLLRYARARNEAARFHRQDFLEELPPADYVLSIQVLSFIEDWRPALGRLLAAAGKVAFITSLFWDGVSTHTHATDPGHKAVHYYVIGAEEFKAACGGRAVRWYPFVSDPPLQNDHTRLGTYTASGRDFTGPIFLPWRIAAVTT